MSKHCGRRKCNLSSVLGKGCACSCPGCRALNRAEARASASKSLAEGKGKTLSVCVSFGGTAAQVIRHLHENGLDGATIELVVEGLALAELRRRMREDGP
jgi:hypothetical protein